MNPLIQSKNTTILPVLIALTLGCFGLLPQARAVCQDGCLTNFNTVLGDDALLNNPGSFNTAIGAHVLLNNQSNGWFNTAIGWQALLNNTNGGANNAIGADALYSNTTGISNTAIGNGALFLNSTGGDNTAIGPQALTNTTGSNNIAVGAYSGFKCTTGSNNIYISNHGFNSDDKAIRIGEPKHRRTFIAGISGVTVAGGVGVIVDTNGQLGTVVSSERFKDGIKPMYKASEAILALKPVTFRYKHELDPQGIPQFGLVAEDVEKVNPALVARDADGKVYTVRYDAVNAMLLNEFLKEHRTVQEQEATIAQLKSAVAKQETTAAHQQKDFQATAAHLQKQIEALTVGLQKVSAQLEASKPAPHVVKNP